MDFWILRTMCFRLFSFADAASGSGNDGDQQKVAQALLFPPIPPCPSPGPSTTTKHTRLVITPSLSSYMGLKGSCETLHPVEGPSVIESLSVKFLKHCPHRISTTLGQDEVIQNKVGLLMHAQWLICTCRFRWMLLNRSRWKCSVWSVP